MLTVTTRDVPSIVVTVKDSLGSDCPAPSACTAGSRLFSRYVHAPLASMLKVPCPLGTPTLVCGLKAASPESGSLTVSVPETVVAESSTAVPLALPPMTAASGMPRTSSVIWLGIASNAPELSCTLNMKFA